MSNVDHQGNSEWDHLVPESTDFRSYLWNS
jgi:hypothetical protein